MTLFKKCILHIGGEKTGTTTLQSFLNENRASLLEQGFFVPRSLGSHEHILLGLYAMDADRRNAPRRRRNHNTPELIEDFRGKLKERFLKEVAGAPQGATLVISSERLHTQVTRTHELQRVYDLIKPLCEEIVVILYMRPQIDLAVSLYTTILLNGEIPEAVLPHDPLNLGSYDYEGSLDRWTDLLGPQSIRPRIFSNSDLLNSDTCEDFCSLSDIDIRPLRRVPRKNESLSIDAQLFLTRFNKYVPVQLNERPNSDRGLFGRLLKENYRGVGMQPSQAEAREFYGLFETTNERIRARWFPDRPTLFEVNFEKFPAVSDQATHQLSLDGAFEIFGNVWTANQRASETSAIAAKMERTDRSTPALKRNNGWDTLLGFLRVRK